MSAEPTTYNVYRVLFRQRRGPDHEAITLVPAQNEDQGAGWEWNVTRDRHTGSVPANPI